MSDYEYIKELSLSDYYTYRALSNGYDWITPEMLLFTRVMVEKIGISSILTSPEYLNFMGIGILNMPYTEDSPENYSFKIPIFLNTKGEDIQRMNTIGSIYKNIISPVMTEPKIKFNSKTKFILYNHKIEINDDADQDDVNEENIIINVVSIFLLQIYKRGVSNDGG